MKNGSKEPDWGKFGLDGERQPLNPGSSGLEHQRAAKEGKDLYGGHVVEDNELFADDQVRSIMIFFCVHVHVHVHG